MKPKGIDVNNKLNWWLHPWLRFWIVTRKSKNKTLMLKENKTIWELPKPDAFYPENDCTDTPLELLLRSVFGFGESKHFQIFGYLCKDLMDYLTTKGYSDKATETFRKAFVAAMGRDRTYWEKCHPAVYGDPCALGMPSGFTQLSVNQCWAEVFCELQGLEPCDCKDENSDTHTLPTMLGWSFFREYAPTFAPFLKDYQPDDTKLYAVQILDLAKLLLGKAVPDKPHWYPVILYISLLLHKTNFEIIPDETEATDIDAIF